MEANKSQITMKKENTDPELAHAVVPFSRDLFWLAHVSHIDVTNVNLPLHQSIFHFQLSKCSFGALIDRFTFTDQGSWDECDCDGITAIFNFTKDQIQLPDTAVRLDIQFSELIIEPENENGDTFYSIYIYFDSVPALWKSEYKNQEAIFQRIIRFQGQNNCDIGKFSNFS
ncbi:hypothetical protein LSH36_266g04078 [Paralvinella palmiformis]|uniref:Uncharacterized protein n=1 Tax=Paralvinella palmiformis TaxID=53620 RepID=A0AAD9N2P6_9ANNE|nr:hypothetical protein LSH36_266g04078 [Paralvinella palmiformis]